MNKKMWTKRAASLAMIATMWALPLASMAQTQITAPKNKYPVQTDVTEGNKAANQVEQKFPLINDADSAQYLQRVGQRLVSGIPNQFDQPAFNYRFKWVNASDLNAFALPGGPMYVNRGMLEAAQNEGELAGVMAHEISHVALRHATAQATKQSSAKNTLGTIGLILGGAILGGNAGAQLGAGVAGLWSLKYSREYESQADALGARIMADAGYDPRDLANVFQTIAKQGGGSGPEWLSSHPDPGNRYQKINQEAQYLRVSNNPIKITRDFERVKARFRAMPKAPTMAQIEKGGYGTGGGTENPTAGGQYSRNVPYPSSQVRAYNGVNWLRVNVPSNWQQFESQGGVQFAPNGAYGNQGITRGAMIGVYQGQNKGLSNATQDYVNGVLSENSYLRQNGGYSQTYLANRQAYTVQLSGRSPVTNQTEIVTVYTTQLRNGSLFYAITVVPSGESGSYSYAFRNMLNSIRLND